MWESEEGQNLLVSVILYPHEMRAVEQFIVSMAVSLGVADFVSSHTPGCRIKWPNDVYVSDGKIAGILIENSVMNGTIVDCVAGIGLNVNQDVFAGAAPNPVSLRQLTGRRFDLDSCLGELCRCLDKRYERIAFGAYNEITDDYNANLYLRGEWSPFSDARGAFTGRIVSVNRYGIMTVETRSGELREYSFKEIRFTGRHQ